MKHFINAKNNIVTEALDGFLATTTTTGLARLDGYPHTKVIIRTDWDKSRVAVIAGGGSGHEPAHTGFVGEAMLTAAVCGEVFASPGVDAVLAAIIAVTGEAGCLLIVKNYTGDRLNFGLAAERANALGYRVEMVVVADDIAIPDADYPRGLAGTLFIHKIAGFMAARGDELDRIVTAARTAASRCYSIGLSLDSCTVPGNIPDDYLGPNEAELGLGIHGEPGFSKIAFAKADELMSLACEKLAQAAAPGPFALILNNLGTVPPVEMAILANAFTKTALAKKTTIIIGPAHLMTSLNMNGFSLSLLVLDDLRTAALRADVGASSWPGIRVCDQIRVVELPKTAQDKSYRPSRNETVEAIIRAVCEMLISAEDELNFLDSRIGDGDTGTTFGRAARTIADALNDLPCADGGDLSMALSTILSRNMGGSSGVLLAILFMAAGKAYKKNNDWPLALFHGARRMMQYGGADVGDRTMLDALMPGLDRLMPNGSMASESIPGESMAAAALAARAGANSTALMTTACAGRASYVQAENLAGVTDPGAEAIARIFETVAVVIRKRGPA
ncbi:MAG: DAK2 domain-containing protein [Alphaproteobacteria bacterium]|nr:DAK2 domain-containing protein [Alphaproteobacteria bacterium]